MPKWANNLDRTPVRAKAPQSAKQQHSILKCQDSEGILSLEPETEIQSWYYLNKIDCGSLDFVLNQINKFIINYILLIFVSNCFETRVNIMIPDH